MSDWNAALDAAIKAVQHAPVFPKKDGGGPLADAERIHIITVCGDQIEKLRRPG